MVQSARDGEGGGGSSGGGSAGGLPGSPPTPLGLPENVIIHRLFGFDGVNTDSPTTHIEDQQLVWCDNFQPRAPGKLIALADLGTPTYTAPGGTTIVGQPWHYNLGDTLYQAVVLSDGSVQQVRDLTPFTVTQIMPPGSIPTPGTTNFDFSQWGAQFLLICANAGNGYWIWDGSILYTTGTLGPSPQITASSVGYATVPTITARGGTGTGATFTATLDSKGSISNIRTTNSGTGYIGSDPTTILLTFSGGTGITVRSAYGTATVQNGSITAATLTNGGTGYINTSGIPQFPAVSINDPGGGSGATVIITGNSGGVLTGLRVVAGGTGYKNPTLVFTGGSGVNAAGTLTVSDGVITGFTISDGGLGYSGSPIVHVYSNGGSGFSGTATVDGTDGHITNVNITSNGSGYSTNNIVGFESSTTTGPPYATTSLMPFGVQGDTVAPFLSRVWIARYNPPFPTIIQFTAPGDLVNFGPPGGATPINDEYLRFQVVHLVPNGSFLYIIGDSSVGYITGVSTSGTPAITTFSIVNIDPEIGASWRDSVFNFGQQIIFANYSGIYAVTGGTVRLVSKNITDTYAGGILNLQTGSYPLPSGAKGIVGGIRVYGILMPITNPFNNTPLQSVVLFDGRRWFFYTPSVALKRISTSEIGSLTTMWGNDDTTIHKLFQTFNNAITKSIITKAYTEPSIFSDKKTVAVAALVESPAPVTLTIEATTSDNNTTASCSPSFPAISGFPGWGRGQIDGVFGKAIRYNIFTNSDQPFGINELLFAVRHYDIRLP